MNREKAERCLKIGLLGALLTLACDLLIGAAKFPDGANMIEGYFAVALAMPAWRPVLGGMIGFAGICLEFPAMMTICPLINEKMPRSGQFYKLAMYVYLALGGGAVHRLLQRRGAVSEVVLHIQSDDRKGCVQRGVSAWQYCVHQRDRDVKYEPWSDCHVYGTAAWL